MTHFRFAGVFALCAALPLAAEAEFVGGRAAISHSAFTDDNDFAKSQAQGAVEFAFGNSFGLQADMGIAGLHALDDTAFNLTGHAVWTFAPGSAAGLFYGSDLMSGPDHDIYGAEYAGFLGEAKVEGYLARSESGEGDANMIGLAGVDAGRHVRAGDGPFRRSRGLFVRRIGHPRRTERRLSHRRKHPADRRGRLGRRRRGE